MKRPYPTCSQLKLASGCLYPWRSHVEWRSDPPGVPSRVGTAVHAIIEAVLRGEPYSEALVHQEAYRQAVDTLPVLELASTWWSWAQGERLHGGDVERAFVFDGTSTRTLGTSLARDYGDARGIIGTADVVHYGVGDGSGTACVTDWKTSLGVDTSADPAADNHQLHALAAMASADRVRLVVITSDRVRVDEAPAWRRDVVLDGLRDLMSRIDADDAEPRVGSHCDWCPVRSTCPALAKAETAIVGAERPRLDLTTGAGIVEARAYLKRVREVCDEVDGAIKEHVRSAGGKLDLGNGKSLKLATRSTSRIEWTAEQKQAARDAGQEKTSSYEVMVEVKS